MKRDRKQLEAIAAAAEKFKAKVERDSPKCFVPSRELQALFDALETRQ